MDTRVETESPGFKRPTGFLKMKHALKSQRVSILLSVVPAIPTLVLHRHHRHQNVVVVTTVLTQYGRQMLMATPVVVASHGCRQNKAFLKNKHVFELPMKSSR
jgi:hypothetical protein